MRQTPTIRQRLHRSFLPLIGITFFLFVALTYFTVQQVIRFEDAQVLNAELSHIASMIVVDNVVQPQLYNWNEPHHQFSQARIDPFFVQVFDQQKRLIYASKNLKAIPFKYPQQLLDDSPVAVSALNESLYTQQKVLIGSKEQPLGYVQIGRFVPKRDHIFRAFFWSFIGIALCLLFAWWLLLKRISHRLTLPLHTIIHDTQHITSASLHQRISLPPNTDLEAIQLTKTINKLLARLEHSFLEMRHFTSHAAHELKTPLTALQGTIEVALRRERTPESYQKTLETLHHETKGMSQMVQSLLSLARLDIETGANEEMLDMNQLLYEVLENFKDLATGKGILLELHDEQIAQKTVQKTVQIKGNREQIRLVLNNLLDNAFKYTEQGAIRVVLNAEYLDITDSGCGIPPEDMLHLGKRFFRSKTVTHIAGSGLGWAICTEILKRHGIEWKVLAAVPHGTTVRLFW